jgi:flagellar motility protein MotE (MotC chaperone)
MKIMLIKKKNINQIIVLVLTFLIAGFSAQNVSYGENKKSESENSKSVNTKPLNIKSDAAKQASPASTDSSQESLRQQKVLNLQKWENDLTVEAKRLEVVKSDIDKRINENNKILAQINAGIKFINDINTDRFQNLVKVYEAMKPSEAAKSLSELDINIQVSLFSAMKVPKAAKILPLMDASKVAKITANMTGIMKNVPK